MATKLYLVLGTACDIQPDGNDGLLGLTAGTSTQSNSTATVAGPTAGVQAKTGAVNVWWLSHQLSAVTISGTVTFNLWGLESNAMANAGFDVLVERCNSAGAVISTIVRSERGVELGTTAAANNWTATPTSTTLADGDRIRVTVFGNDAGGTMASTYTFTLDTDGSTAAADGDSYVQFTETITEQVAGQSRSISSTIAHTATEARMGVFARAVSATNAMSALVEYAGTPPPLPDNPRVSMPLTRFLAGAVVVTHGNKMLPSRGGADIGYQSHERYRAAGNAQSGERDSGRSSLHDRDRCRANRRGTGYERYHGFAACLVHQSAAGCDHLRHSDLQSVGPRIQYVREYRPGRTGRADRRQRYGPLNRRSQRAWRGSRYGTRRDELDGRGYQYSDRGRRPAQIYGLRQRCGHDGRGLQLQCERERRYARVRG